MGIAIAVIVIATGADPAASRAEPLRAIALPRGVTERTPPQSWPAGVEATVPQPGPVGGLDPQWPLASPRSSAPQRPPRRVSGAEPRPPSGSHEAAASGPGWFLAGPPADGNLEPQLQARRGGLFSDLSRSAATPPDELPSAPRFFNGLGIGGEAAPVPPVEPLRPWDPSSDAGRDWLLLNYYDPFSNQFAFGNQGNQPYRFDAYSYDDFTYLPTSAVRGTTGSFQDLQWNAWMRFSRAIGGRYILAWTPTWNSSFWTGPSGVALPPDVDQIKSDFQLSSAQPGPWNWQLGFTPQINADFRHSLNHNAYLFDGRAVLFYQPSTQWRFALGMAYWDRVRGLLIPYGGVVWTPNERWEIRLFFPKTRISRYWGQVWGKDVWTYASLEYNLQAYQIEIEDASKAKTRMQLASEQLLLGASAYQANWTAFVEGGFVFDRHVRFGGSVPSFGINDALMLRIGALY